MEAKGEKVNIIYFCFYCLIFSRAKVSLAKVLHQLCLVAMCKSASAEINRSDDLQGWSSTRTRGGLSYVNLTHHVHDLLESQTKLQDHSVGLIGHRPLQSLVLRHQVVDESPLVGAADDH